MTDTNRKSEPVIIYMVVDPHEYRKTLTKTMLQSAIQQLAKSSPLSEPLTLEPLVREIHEIVLDKRPRTFGQGKSPRIYLNKKLIPRRLG